MDLNGEAIRESRRWRAHVATAIIVAMAVMVLGLATGTLRRDGGGTERLATAPGYNDADVPIDTSPFALAEATKQGPTTLPGEPGFAPQPDFIIPSMTTTSTIPPSTLPTPMHNAPADDPRCLGVQQIAEVYRLLVAQLNDPRSVAGLAVRHFSSAAEFLRQASDPTLDTLIAALDQSVAEARLAETIDEMIQPLDRVRGLYQAGGPEMEPLLDHLRRSCPGFLDTSAQ